MLNFENPTVHRSMEMLDEHVKLFEGVSVETAADLLATVEIHYVTLVSTIVLGMLEDIDSGEVRDWLKAVEHDFYYNLRRTVKYATESHGLNNPYAFSDVNRKVVEEVLRADAESDKSA